MKISELLREDDADDLVGAAKTIAGHLKAGHDSAKGHHERVAGVEKGAAEKSKGDYNKALKQLITNYLSGFFDKFPNYDPIETEFTTTRENAVMAFKAFREITSSLQQLVDNMNNGALKSGVTTSVDMKRFKLDAERLKATRPPAQLTSFVRAEADFFKGLFTIKDDFGLDIEGFKDKLQRKIRTTATPRIPDAVHALNILFAHLIYELNDTAKAIADEGRKLPATTPASP